VPRIVIYPSLESTGGREERYDSFEALCEARFSKPRVIASLAEKNACPMFGPYGFRSGGCRRNNAHVAGIGLAVFDVDQGDAASVAESRRRIEAAGLAQHWYTSVSFDPAAPKQNWRLIIPLAEEVSEAGWQRIRADFIRAFRLAVEENKCNGFSHAYFLPAVVRGRQAEVVSLGGRAYEPSSPSLAQELGPVVEVAPRDEEDGEPPSTETLAEFRATLSRRAQRYAQDGDLYRATLVQRALAGEDIVDGQHVVSRSGDPPLAALCLIVVRTLPFPQPRAAYRALLDASAEKSPVSWRKYLGMIDSAIRRRDEENEAAKSLASAIEYAQRRVWGE
jgi:hypothetical protein